MWKCEELAHAPGREGSSFGQTKKHILGRVFERSVVLALLCTVACSHVVPPEASHAAPTAKEGGTGTRAKGEEGRAGTGKRYAVEAPATLDLAQEAAPRELDRAATRSAGAAAPAAPPAKDKAVAASPAKPDANKAQAEAAEFGIVGLVGLGAAGGGLGAAQGQARVAGPTMRMAAGGHAAHQREGVPPATAAPLAPAPAPQFDTEAYKSVHDNPFRLVTEAPLSTFSVDVDTASYSNMRRFVEEGRLPPPDSIRVEEWVNYFSYDDPAPQGDEPVAVASELTECPWNGDHRLLRVALTTRPIAQAEVPPRNLVFLVDVSGSMEDANKLPLLKRGLALLARQLRPIDTLSIAVYAGSSGLALPPTSGADQGKILATLEKLQAGGSTNGAEGIQLAYQIAERQFKKGGINRVILATDGDFNVGTTSEGDLERLITEKRKSGVFLTVLGFGQGNLKDSTMETLADKGNGNYAYIDSLAEARKVLVREAGATLVTVAQDVKLQLEFNPARVKGYRLVGYENRVLADQDFNDDAKDAGELGAGHHVTAFYEIVPAGALSEVPGTAAGVDPLKYQTARTPSSQASSGDLVTVKIRYKAPGGSKSLLFARTVQDDLQPLANASDSVRFGAAVAEYALALRGAPGVGEAVLKSARTLAASAVGADPSGERREFVALMDRARTFPKN